MPLDKAKNHIPNEAYVKALICKSKVEKEDFRRAHRHMRKAKYL